MSAAARVLPRSLGRIGLQAATKPVPHFILLGIVLIGVSWAVGNAIDKLTDKSGLFDDLFEGHGI